MRGGLGGGCILIYSSGQGGREGAGAVVIMGILVNPQRMWCNAEALERGGGGVGN